MLAHYSVHLFNGSFFHFGFYPCKKAGGYAVAVIKVLCWFVVGQGPVTGSVGYAKFITGVIGNAFGYPPWAVGLAVILYNVHYLVRNHINIFRMLGHVINAEHHLAISCGG